MWKVEIKRPDNQPIELHEDVELELNVFNRTDRGFGYGEDALQITKDGEHIITIGFNQSVAKHAGETQRRLTFHNLGFTALGIELHQDGSLIPFTPGASQRVEIEATNV